MIQSVVTTNDAITMASYYFNDVILVENPLSGDRQLGYAAFEASKHQALNARKQRVNVRRQVSERHLCDEQAITA
jgi:hypothetical protein